MKFLQSIPILYGMFCFWYPFLRLIGIYMEKYDFYQFRFSGLRWFDMIFLLFVGVMSVVTTMWFFFNLKQTQPDGDS